MKLMMDKREVITCAYTKGDLCRRAYWLIENPRYVIVQYLKSKQESIPTADKMMQEIASEANKFPECEIYG